jgi:hypothetical protein
MTANKTLTYINLNACRAPEGRRQREELGMNPNLCPAVGA